MGDNSNQILWTASEAALPKLLWDRLEGLGYSILLSEHHEHFLKLIQRVTPGLWVGQIDGHPETEWSRIESVRSEFPELPIVLLSKRPSVDEAVKAIKVGATDYASEGISPEKLCSILEGALNYVGHGSPPPRNLKEGSFHHLPEAPVASDPSMVKILELAKKIAPSRSNILIQGESGTGKEVVACYIHQCSHRRKGPFVAVNCAALPENLLESELFGHERGAFTGAVSRKKGKFELANAGTLLLDEISETAPSIQAKLLRVLQEREIDRVGGQFSVPVDTRVIATTNRDLQEETQKGRFRLDLFYRLNVVPLKLPPLRQRPDDIIPLACYFLKKHASLNQVEQPELSPEAQAFLRQKTWPGNVRELENLMERATLLVDSNLILAGHLEDISHPKQRSDLETRAGDAILPLREMERRAIFRALDARQGNRTHAAKMLGISVRTLRNKLNEYEKELENEGV
jgi:two-component system response regulator FlrC